MSSRSSVKIPLGVPPRVDLVPRKERDRRDRARLLRRWTAATITAIVAMAVASAGMSAYESRAKSDLSAERSQTTVLQGEAAPYAGVAGALREKSTYQQLRSEAMGADLAWTSLYDRIRARTPMDAKINSFGATVGTASAVAATPGTSTASATVAPGTAVSVTLVVTSPHPLDERAMLVSFQHITGVLAVDLINLAGGQGKAYTYTTQIDFDDSVYSGRYTQEAR